MRIAAARIIYQTCEKGFFPPGCQGNDTKPNSSGQLLRILRCGDNLGFLIVLDEAVIPFEISECVFMVDGYFKSMFLLL